MSNPVKEPSDPKYKPTVVFKIPHIGALSSGGTMNGDRVGSIHWIKSKTPLMVKGKYGKDYPAVRLFMALDDKFTTFTDKFMGSDGEIRQPNFGDIDPKSDLVKVWYKASDVWKSPKGLSISLTVTKVVFFPGPRKIKAEFGGLTQVEPTAEQLAKLCGVAIPSAASASSASSASSSAAGGGGASGGASGQVPVFDEDEPYLADMAAAESLRVEEMEREEREALEKFVRSEEKDAAEQIAASKKRTHETFESPDRSSSAAPSAPKKVKKTKREEDE